MGKKLKAIPKKLKDEVYRTKGRLCWLRLDCCIGTATTVDHYVARALGGSDHIDNLIPACGPCNSKKGGIDGARIKKMRRH